MKLPEMMAFMKIRLWRLLLAHLIILQPLVWTQPATADSVPSQLSLAISGGASKGAYEAGLIWGLIEVLHQAEMNKEWALGGELRSLEIASVAGTSAGGINTVLAALTWSVKPENEGGFTNRIDDNIFRDVWLTPDVNRLLPPDPDSPLYLPVDAVLSRKDLVAVSRKLRDKWRRPGSFRPGLRLPLGVTVTRVRPDSMSVSGIAVENQRFFIPFEMRTRTDGSAEFYFDPMDYPYLTDPDMILMPWSDDRTPFSVSDQQIEDALLTTSAFPGGFGRKRLQYCRQKAFSAVEKSAGKPSKDAAGAGEKPLVCPEGYELAEAEFADGGLFDNLPIGLARLLSESSTRHRKQPLPVNYIYIDPDRQRYDTRVPEDLRACDGDPPPDACREMTFNLASEMVVLGGAIGTARKFELFRELTGKNWQLNLNRLSQQLAGLIDRNQLEVNCASELPFFDRRLKCSDRLRATGQLLELAHTYRFTTVRAPLSASALMKERIARTCRPPAAGAASELASECMIDAPRLRKQLATVLIDLSVKTAGEDSNLKMDIQRSALSIDSDRTLNVPSRGGPITGSLLGAFGAFIDYKFREYDYFVGIYDAVVNITNIRCTRNFPSPNQHAQRSTCRERLSEALYQRLGVADNPKGRYLFARMAKQEYGKRGDLRFAYDSMPPEDRDVRILFEGLNKSVPKSGQSGDDLEDTVSSEREFFEHLKAEGFEPTPPPEGGRSLLALIMDDPEFWTHELIKRATARMVYLEQQADAIYRAREPDPELRESAHTALMGAGALVLRTATYKYPTFSFAPSTAPESWFWRNIIPYELTFDLLDADVQILWQPTLSFKYFNAGIRFGLGFTGGVFSSSGDEQRENYGTVGLDLTRNVPLAVFSGWGITPAVYHQWQKPEKLDQTTFGLDVHANLLNNRLRISFGARDIFNKAGDTLFLTIGLADLPGLMYWLSR
jgi:hypothetical protein